MSINEKAKVRGLRRILKRDECAHSHILLLVKRHVAFLLVELVEQRAVLSQRALEPRLGLVMLRVRLGERLRELRALAGLSLGERLLLELRAACHFRELRLKLSAHQHQLLKTRCLFATCCETFVRNCRNYFAVYSNLLLGGRLLLACDAEIGVRLLDERDVLLHFGRELHLPLLHAFKASAEFVRVRNELLAVLLRELELLLELGGASERLRRRREDEEIRERATLRDECSPRTARALRRRVQLLDGSSGHNALHVRRHTLAALHCAQRRLRVNRVGREERHRWILIAT